MVGLHGRLSAIARHTAAKTAQARGLGLDHFTEIVWENAARVFGWE